tara:strand:+ start:847 stop:1137 length:291 start_codon:yes stop_codon:yes gene_type:complete
MKTITSVGTGPHSFKVGENYNFQVSIKNLAAGETAQVLLLPANSDSTITLEDVVTTSDLVVFEVGHADTVQVEKTGGGAFQNAQTTVTFSRWWRAV